MADGNERHHAGHLEFLGYECELQPDGWLHAAHPTRWNFFLKAVEIGVLFHCTIRIGLLTDARRSASIEFINRTNQHSLLARFTLEYDVALQSFLVRARMVAPLEYRRKEFGVWMDIWHKDLERLGDAPWTEVDEEEEEKPETRAESTVN
jgi:hypothetical protein